MITKKQLLQAPESELPKILGEILIGCRKQKTISIKCVCGNTIKPKRKPGGWEYKCPYVLCGHPHNLTEDDFIKPPPTIDIHDWNVAMKFRDKAVEKHGMAVFTQALYEVLKQDGLLPPNRSYSQSLEATIAKAQPVNYLIAAALLELSE